MNIEEESKVPPSERALSFRKQLAQEYFGHDSQSRK